MLIYLCELNGDYLFLTQKELQQSNQDALEFDGFNPLSVEMTIRTDEILTKQQLEELVKCIKIDNA